MEKFIFDKNNGLWYELQGDYYIPCLTAPTKDELSIDPLGTGIFGTSGQNANTTERCCIIKFIIDNYRPIGL